MRSCRAWIPLALAMLVTVGCGTRVHEDKNAGGVVPTAAVIPSGGVPVPASSDPGASGSDPGLSATQSTVGRAAPTGAGSGSGARSTAATASGGSTASKVPSASGAASGRPGDPGPAAAGPASGRGPRPRRLYRPAPVAPPRRHRQPVGRSPRSSSATSAPTAAPWGVRWPISPKEFRFWARWINDRGGLNGHPVKFVVADDGADPARHRALVQQMVETQGAIALVGDGEVVTGASSVEYLTGKGSRSSATRVGATGSIPAPHISRTSPPGRPIGRRSPRRSRRWPRPKARRSGPRSPAPKPRPAVTPTGCGRVRAR